MVTLVTFSISTGLTLRKTIVIICEAPLALHLDETWGSGGSKLGAWAVTLCCDGHDHGPQVGGSSASCWHLLKYVRKSWLLATRKLPRSVSLS